MAAPSPRTGWAAPVLVPGAMAATSAASRMKKPAEEASLPAGRYIDDDRDCGSQKLLDDGFHGSHQAAGGTQFDQKSIGVHALRFLNGAVNALRQPVDESCHPPRSSARPPKLRAKQEKSAKTIAILEKPVFEKRLRRMVLTSRLRRLGLARESRGDIAF